MSVKTKNLGRTTFTLALNAGLCQEVILPWKNASRTTFNAGTNASDQCRRKKHTQMKEITVEV